MTRALDLCCNAGGASWGLVEAGFNVVGIDIDESAGRHYPVHPRAEFRYGNVLDLDLDFIRQFDFVWASPPCQRYSRATKRHGTQGNHPDLVAPVRDMLERSGVPYAMENVEGSPLRQDALLCSGWTCSTVTESSRPPSL